MCVCVCVCVYHLPYLFQVKDKEKCIVPQLLVCGNCCILKGKSIGEYDSTVIGNSETEVNQL